MAVHGSLTYWVALRRFNFSKILQVLQVSISSFKFQFLEEKKVPSAEALDNLLAKRHGLR
jgi:hypothetical protein